MHTIRERLRAAGARPTHERRILRAWLSGGALASRAHAHDQPFPRALIAELASIETELDALVRIVSEHPGEDGSSRLLLALDGGMTVESVLLPRDGLCISSQVGCAVGCVFCMTGRSGLLRQLSSREMVAQVVLARRKRTVRRVVFMGMGEPSHNLANVLDAIDALGTWGELAHKNIVFSTVGDRRAFERLADNAVKPALALSLHTTDAALRDELLPRAPRIAPEELVDLAEAYARATTYPIQYQWTLIEGVNDTDRELERLTALMRGKLGVVNFIPYNAVDGLPWKRPSLDRARAMSQHLHQHGVLCKLRRSAGQDVDGACGQLRARALHSA
jgi:23S rRNA (adenine2503-C2)-methyltransferase